MVNQQIKRAFYIASIVLFGLVFGTPTLGANPLDPRIGNPQTTDALSPAQSTTVTNRVFLPIIVGPPAAPPVASTDWPMVAANPQRTSWTPEEIRGNLSVQWYRPIEPYINYKIQPIAANGTIYVSTAKGLYAFSATDGTQLWVYATEMPLGNSPTIATVNGKSIAYVGSYDRKVYAIDALTGQAASGFVPFQAGAGFETNPLVIQDSYTNNVPTIFMGNRDGYFYALNAQTGALIWKYQTNGPILFSAAYKNGTLYVASNDDYAYALNARNGALVWQSAKFPGQGFYSYWPVIYTNKSTGKDYVVLATGHNYRQNDLAPTGNYAPGLQGVETELFFANTGSQLIGATGMVSGDWVPGTVTMDASLITKYYANQPYRRTVFVLDRSTGQEYSFTDPVTGKPTYAPFSWSGVAHGGVRYPPIVNGIDGVLYQQTAYYNGGWVSRGGPVGWKFGTQYISQIAQSVGNPDTTATDEPSAFSSGGKIVYRALCCDRLADGFDITIPYGKTDANGNKRNWTYFGYSLNSIAPGYNQMYNDGTSSYTDNNGFQEYTGTKLNTNGIYGKHGTNQSPAIPYKGKLYFLRGNSLLAFSPTGGARQLALATIATPQVSANPLTNTEVSQRLASEIQKMLNAGHLQPGYFHSGQIDQYGRGGYTDDREFGEIFDYFDNPADTVVTLLAALPHLSTTMQSQVKTYLQTYYGLNAPYDLTKIVHTGWNTGAPRSVFEIPIDVQSLYTSGSNWRYAQRLSPYCGSCQYWKYFTPYSYYAAWKYAQAYGNNATIANSVLTSLSNNGHSTPEAPALDDKLLMKPHWMNQYLAGYLGYLNLLQMAGKPDNSTIRGYYNHLLSLRTVNFSKDWPVPITNQEDPKRAISVMRNFLYITPEIGDYMNKNISATKLQQAVDEYNYLAPYWFVSKFDNSYNESTLEPLYDYPALFQAKAYILKQPFSQLAKYIDVPAFPVGDLYYIQNLTAALSAAP